MPPRGASTRGDERLGVCPAPGSPRSTGFLESNFGFTPLLIWCLKNGRVYLVTLHPSLESPGQGCIDKTSSRLDTQLLGVGPGAAGTFRIWVIKARETKVGHGDGSGRFTGVRKPQAEPSGGARKDERSFQQRGRYSRLLR